MTKAFNQGERDAFLISLKAGGVGLNLTGADTVILVAFGGILRWKRKPLAVPIGWGRKKRLRSIAW